MSMTFNVSIVDDDREMLELVCSRLKKSETFVCRTMYEDPLKAVRCLPDEKPDIVLMDINMPGMNGIETIRQLKMKIPECSFIILTVYDDTNHIFEALAAGAIGYLLKRDVGKKLIDALNETIKGGSPMDSSIARRVVQSFEKPLPAGPDVKSLSSREEQVLHMLAKGLRRKEIADELNVSHHTIDSYIRRTYEKLQVNSCAEAVAKYSGH